MSYLNDQQVSAYFENGFLLVPNVYSLETISNIRTMIDKSRTNGIWNSSTYFNDHITTDIYSLFPELIEMVFSDSFVSIMKGLMGGNSVLIPEPAMHRNRYYNWHKDSSYLEKLGETFQWNTDFEVAQTVMYLQDNHPQYGGGLTVINKSQHSQQEFNGVQQSNLAGKVLLKIKKMLWGSPQKQLEKDQNKLDIPSKAGDLIIFSYNLTHRATFPLNELRSVSDKLAIFNTVCKSDKYVSQINNCLRKVDNPYSNIFLKNNLHLPEALLERIDKLGLKAAY